MKELYLCEDDVARLSLLPDPLFRMLIEHHRRSIGAAGLDPDGITSADALWERHTRIPMDLVDALHRIGELADEDGVDQIVQAAGGPLFAGVVDRVPVVFATRTYLEHPRIFDRASGRRIVETVRPFNEFVAAPGTAVQRRPDLSGAELRIGRALDRRARGPECRIKAWTEADGGQYFAVTHSACPRIDRRDDGDRHVVHQSTRELLTFEPGSRLLRVNADDPAMTAMLVREFGQALLGDPDAFDYRVRVSLDGLLAHGSQAVTPTPGVLAVKVHHVEIASRTAGNEVITISGDDVLHRLTSGALHIPQGPVRAARLRLQLRGERRPREVHLRVPFEMAWDWRRWNRTIRAFLVERGFLLGPREGGAKWLAA